MATMTEIDPRRSPTSVSSLATWSPTGRSPSTASAAPRWPRTSTGPLFQLWGERAKLV